MGESQKIIYAFMNKEVPVGGSEIKKDGLNNPSFSH